MTPTEIKAKAQAIRDREEIYNLDLHKRILKAWRILRPQMWAKLKEDGTAEDLALVLQVAMWNAVDQYEKAGMPPTDARELAEREWLLMEPENEPEPISLEP
jgi:hypothetical protein